MLVMVLSKESKGLKKGLLHEMLRSVKTGDLKSTWKVLIMDKLTIRIMSHSCKMADITDEGVSLVEDIYKRRQPMPTMDAIYFIQPTKEKYISSLLYFSNQKFASGAVMLKPFPSPYFLYGLLDGRLILTNLMDFSE
ncbi:hypothetical protein RJT34_13369 [Clitoria ternatea]|uniref:Uncharacterized protein n=1 Tax=Clitoria ternatea TaxID=43366 RepID=A0AAN9PLR2_CLITE